MGSHQFYKETQVNMRLFKISIRSVELSIVTESSQSSQRTLGRITIKNHWVKKNIGPDKLLVTKKNFGHKKLSPK